MRSFLASLLVCVAVVLPSALQSKDLGQPPVRAPFEDLDTLCVNDWWNQPPSPIVDLDVPRDQVIAFGIYTVSQGTLKLSAQLFPLYPQETREVRLEIKDQNGWREIQSRKVNDIGWHALFRVEGWDTGRDTPYRLRHGERAVFEGLIRKDPVDKQEIVLAALSCDSNKDRGAREEYVRNLRHLDPDLIFFAGDQSYDHKEHTAAWIAHGLEYREAYRDRPCVTIPDDHDIGQGNLWGEGGIVASRRQGDDGGYFYHHEYVKMVERAQTSHLPDPYDPSPVGQGIGVYYTSLNVGGVDFAIIEDRKFKSGPAGKIPQQGPRPDHINDPGYDPATIDLPGLKLLGDRQLAFLYEWGDQWEKVEMKAVLSQTGFCGGAHLHGNINNRLFADLDSNGWPQTGRNRALRAIRDAHAVHIAGDQHLATVIQHGIEEFRDGPWAFVVPASINNYYSRWWWPADEQPGGRHDPANPLPWTGDYTDGFGNRITMHAYANPESTDGGSGFGLIRFNKNLKTVTFECWPRHANLAGGEARQFVGWPITVGVPGRQK